MKIVAWDSTERGAPYLTTRWALGAAVLSGADVRVGVSSWLHLARVVTDQAARTNSQALLLIEEQRRAMLERRRSMMGVL